jgi:hypothetical protein
MFEGEVQFVGAGSGICFLPDEGGGSTEGVDGAGMVADPGSGLDWMVDTAGYGSGISGSGSQTYIFESILKIYGSGISGSGSQTYIFESILKIYWVKTNNFLNIGPNICQNFQCDFFGPRKELGNPGSRTNLFRISDPGVKKAPDPGSGSETLVDCYFYHSGP